jgi:hypothetical protein
MNHRIASTCVAVAAVAGVVRADFRVEQMTAKGLIAKVSTQDDDAFYLLAWSHGFCSGALYPQPFAVPFDEENLTKLAGHLGRVNRFDLYGSAAGLLSAVAHDAALATPATDKPLVGDLTALEVLELCKKSEDAWPALAVWAHGYLIGARLIDPARTPLNEARVQRIGEAVMDEWEELPGANFREILLRLRTRDLLAPAEYKQPQIEELSAYDAAVLIRRDGSDASYLLTWSHGYNTGKLGVDMNKRPATRGGLRELGRAICAAASREPDKPLLELLGTLPWTATAEGTTSPLARYSGAAFLELIQKDAAAGTPMALWLHGYLSGRRGYEGGESGLTLATLQRTRDELVKQCKAHPDMELLKLAENMAATD